MTTPEQIGSCEWIDNTSGDGMWDTSCENVFVFIVDGPVENGMKFCPFCGKHLTIEPVAD